MNHGELMIKSASEWGDNKDEKSETKDETVFDESFRFAAENNISSEEEDGRNSYDINETKDCVPTKSILMVVKINNGPSIDVGNAGVIIESVYCVLSDVDFYAICEITGALKIVFTGSGD